MESEVTMQSKAYKHDPHLQKPLVNSFLIFIITPCHLGPNFIDTLVYNLCLAYLPYFSLSIFAVDYLEAS